MAGCSCSQRFTSTFDHESDCILWTIDEFWAQYADWDPEKQCLVRTDIYPADHEDMFSLSRTEADALSTYNDPDPDTYAPPASSTPWEKRSDGTWHPITEGTPVTLDKTEDLWSSHYAKHAHYESKLSFPDGTVVQASSIEQNRAVRHNGEPDFGLYLAPSWRNEGIGMMLPWDDWGLPSVPFPLAAELIKTAFGWAKSGLLVEVGCLGAHGRTGTTLACMAMLAGVPIQDAVDYVRTNYCKEAVEGQDQVWFIKWFNAYINDLPLPERPIKTWTAQQYTPVQTTHYPKVRSSLPPLAQEVPREDAGQITKRHHTPTRTRRGGRRVQRSRRQERSNSYV